MTDNFVEREFKEVPGGYYENDFYYTPNGSFWDAEGFYFNREGYDKHGGYYDDNFNYIHGQGWNQEKGCYESQNTAGNNWDDEYDDYDDLDGDDIPYDPNFKEFDYYDDEISEEAYLDKNDPTIEKIVINSNQATIKNDFNDNVKNSNQQSKNSENKPQAAQNTTNIGKAINPKPKINESALPSLVNNNSNNNANLEVNNSTNQKPAEEKPKTGLAALLAKDSTKSKTTSATNKDDKNSANAVVAQAKKDEKANTQIQKESNARKQSENTTITNANNNLNKKSEITQQPIQEKKIQDQTSKSALSALLNQDKNKQNKTPNKAPQKEKAKEEAVDKESDKTTPLNNTITIQIQEKLEESLLNLNVNKESNFDSNTNYNNEAEKTEDSKGTQNKNSNPPGNQKPKKIMILNKNNDRVKSNNIQTSPNENLINTNNVDSDEKNLTKELEELNIKSTSVEQQNDENPELSSSSNYNYYHDDEFDRSKYSKDIPIASSNDYYRSNNNNNRRILNKKNPVENQAMKIRKNPNNDSNENFNTAGSNNLINNFDDSNQNRTFNNNNKFYQNNNRNNFYDNNNNNQNFNYQNNRSNPNMVKDQQNNKFNNFNKNTNNNNNFNNNNRRFNSNINNFDNGNQMNYGNKKFNTPNQANFHNFQPPYNMPPMNPNIPPSTFINNYNTSLSINYPHIPQMGSLPLNQFPNQAFDDSNAKPKNIKNLTQQQQQAYFTQMNPSVPNQAAYYTQQQMLLQNQANNSNKNFKANPQNNLQNPQFPVNAMNLNYTGAAAFQQGMYQQNMNFMGMHSNPLLNQRAYSNLPIGGGNVENSPGNAKGNLNN